MENDAPRWEIDGDWFRQKLAEVKKSQNALGRHLGLHSAAMTLMFKGRRQMKLEEAEKIARFINASTDEVLSHAGVKLGGDIGDIPLQTLIEEDGRLVPAPAPMAIPTETMNRLKANIPLDRRGNFEVAQVRAKKGGLWPLDDNLVLYETPTTMAPGPASVLSVSKLRDGATVIGKVMDWRKTGEAKIITPDGKEKDANIVASSPVLLIVP